jgi:hypothetical protein
MSDRNARLLAGVTLSDPIIEIGPLHAPIAPKSAGWSTTVVDHATRAELLEKYAGHPDVDPDVIQDVDIVWPSGPLHTAFPDHANGTYKALIASHVIEHLPDLVGFLRSAAQLLDPNAGLLALVVPDKRWCFDLFKPVSTTGQLLAAHRAGATRHAPAHLFDHNAYSASDRGRTCWGQEPLTELSFYVRLEDAKTAFDSWSDDPDSAYVDCHAWQFTPSSFALAILELGELGLIDWRVDWIESEPQTEFITQLRRGREHFETLGEREARRMALLKGVVGELADQARWLLDRVSDSDPASCGEPIARVEAVSGQQLERMEARLATLEDDLRPLRVLLSRALHLRRSIARLRGRT